MPAVGGSIESVILAGREFPVPADVDTQRKLGGLMNEVQANGDGSARLIKTREPWAIDGLTVSIDDDRNDQEFLQDLADRPDYFPVAITYASGAVYGGQGQIVGDLQFGNTAATASVGLSGPQKLAPL